MASSFAQTRREVDGENPYPQVDIELLTGATPNGHKVSIMLEEMGIPYTTTRIDLAKLEQFDEAFTKVNPNAKIPAIIDHANGGFCVFESGAILQYISERCGGVLMVGDSSVKSSDKIEKERYKTMQWLFFQMANLGE